MFREGERYLVYAYYSGQEVDTLLHTDLCSGAKPLSNAGADLEVLGPAELALPERVEPESIGSTPVKGIGSFSDWVITGAVVTLLAVVGSFLLFGADDARDDPGWST